MLKEQVSSYLKTNRFLRQSFRRCRLAWVCVSVSSRRRRGALFYFYRLHSLLPVYFYDETELRASWSYVEIERTEMIRRPCSSRSVPKIIILDIINIWSKAFYVRIELIHYPYLGNGVLAIENFVYSAWNFSVGMFEWNIWFRTLRPCAHFYEKFNLTRINIKKYNLRVS